MHQKLPGYRYPSISFEVDFLDSQYFSDDVGTGPILSVVGSYVRGHMLNLRWSKDRRAAHARSAACTASSPEVRRFWAAFDAV